MPIYVKSHMRAGSSVKAYRKNSKITRARNLKYALGSITARGRFLTKPQKKAFFKASTIIGNHQAKWGLGSPAHKSDREIYSSLRMYKRRTGRTIVKR